MSQNLTRCAVFAALTLGAVQFASAAETPQTPAEKERELIAILKSDTPPGEKAIACKRLAIYGGKDAPSALAPFLADPQLASWARIGLEANPDPAACDILREAMGKLQGNLLIGVINSIGVRRDAKALDALVARLGDANPDVASAAAVALGHMGSEAAIKALESRLASAPSGVRSAIAEGCILGAERSLAEGKTTDATRLYDAVRSANVTKQHNVEATRGAILARGTAGVAILIEQLRSPEKVFFNIGLRTARELPGAEVTRALLDELERTSPDRQTGILLALADRGGPEALPAALRAAKNGPPAQRLVAIAVLERLGNVSCVGPLFEIAGEDDAAISQAARSALTRLPGAEVDAVVVASLKQPGEKARLLGIELAAQRRLNAVIPNLLEMAEGSSPSIGNACIKALGELGDASEIAPLISILLRSKSTAAAESALSSIGSRMSKPATGSVVIRKALYGDLPDGPSADVTAKVAQITRTSASVKASNATFGDPAGGRVKKLCVEYAIDGIPGSQTVNENETVTFALSTVSPVFVDALTGAMAQAPAASKPALLRVLGSTGGAKALATVRGAMQDPDAGMRDAAFETLCRWPSAEALGDLKQLAQSGADQKQKVLAMRGYVRLASQSDIAVHQKLDALKDAMAFAPRDEERKLVLGALGGIRSPQAVKLIEPHLDNPALKEEACMAALSVADSFRKGVPAFVGEAMEKVAKTTSNPDLAKKAKGIAAKAEAPQPKKKR